MTEKELVNKKQSEIIEYYKKKHPTITVDYDAIWNEEHNRAFTITNILKADILQVVLDLLGLNIEKGFDFKIFEKALEKKFEKVGFGYNNRSRFKLVYEINTFLAYGKGRYDSMRGNVDSKPYWVYKCEKLPKSRDEHLKMHDRIYRYDNPIWNYMYPPNGFNCKCSVRAMSSKDVQLNGLPICDDEILTKEENGVFLNGVEIDGKIVTAKKGWNYNPYIEYADKDRMIEAKKYDDRLLPFLK